MPNFEIIGEASKNLPESIKESHPDVEWRKIESFRNVLAHEYFGIDIDILWDIIKNKLPDLSAGIRAIVESEARLSPHDRYSR